MELWNVTTFKLETTNSISFTLNELLKTMKEVKYQIIEYEVRLFQKLN